MSSIRYRPEVDGLRAVAILPVVLFHLNPKWLPGGFVGVDIFFVISGYLITSIILSELESSKFSFASFWDRRIRRILPPLLGVTLFTLLVFPLLRLPLEACAMLGRQVLHLLALRSNHFMLGATGDYWGPAADEMPMLHTWSLAVEEQFYLLFPLAVFFAYRRGRGLLRWLLVALAIASFAACIVLTPGHQAKTFFLLPFRAWELLVGAIVALNADNWVRNMGQRVTARLSDAGLLLILASLFLVTPMNFPGWQAAIPVIGSALYVCCSASGGLASRVLSSPPAVYIGKTSYSVYLWHWPALVLGAVLATLFENENVRTATFLAGLGLALASYHFLEPAGKRSRLTLPACAVAALAAAAVSALLMTHSTPLPSPVSQPTVNKGMSYEGVDVPRQLESLVTTHRWDTIDVEAPRNPLAKMTPVIAEAPGKPVRMVVFGDSHGMMWASALQRIAERNKTGVAFLVASGITPLAGFDATSRLSMDEQERLNALRIDLLERFSPRLVVVATRWDFVADRSQQAQIRDFLKVIGEKAPDARILLISQPPILAIGDRNVPQWLSLRKMHGLAIDTLLELPTASSRDALDFLRKLAAESPRVSLVEVADIYRVQGGRVRAVDNEHVVYADDDHLSEYGAGMAESCLEHAISPLLASEGQGAPK